ncbi:MAG: hypothetical protein GY786_05405 [Proteobacteria bacterium]|nr:hypothetical protein [Pseudomonadota bacterium]
MVTKPTYEELEQRIKELEKEVAERKNAEKSLKEKTHLNNILLDAIPCVALLIRSKTREIVFFYPTGRKAGPVSGPPFFATWGPAG